MNDIYNLGNRIMLSNCSTTELLAEVARRYNLNPKECQQAISEFMYAYDAMETAKEDERMGSSEEGNHGRPF